MNKDEEKWFWMMDWCKNHKVAASNAYWWNKAELEYNKCVKS